MKLSDLPFRKIKKLYGQIILKIDNVVITLKRNEYKLYFKIYKNREINSLIPLEKATIDDLYTLDYLMITLKEQKNETDNRKGH